MRRFVQILIYLLLAAALVAGLVVFAFLQEFYVDDIPDRAAAAGVTMPFEDLRLEISIQRGTLSLFDGEAMVKRWNIAHGRMMAGRISNREGSTPVGEYVVVAKEVRKDILDRGSRFLVLDYPSEYDASHALDVGVISYPDYLRIREALARGDPPPVDTALGGPVGIQGNYFFFRESRFTDGSIALSNSEINQLFEYVPVGTLVIIEH